MGTLFFGFGCQKEHGQEPKLVDDSTNQPTPPTSEGGGKADSEGETPNTPGPKTDEIDVKLFAQPDASFVALPESKAQRAIMLLKQYDPQEALNKESLGMSQGEWQEIRDFTLKLVDPSEDKYKQLLTILGWVHRNIKYEHGDNTAYATFRNRAAICQGKSYLFKAMCHAIDIPVLVAGGYLGQQGGHAWCYAYVEGEWYVADPTNRAHPFHIDNTSAYDRSLIIEQFEGILYEDEAFAYTYEDGMLTVHTIKASEATYIVVPYGVKGVQIGNFNPLIASVKQGVLVYLGDNIRAIGVEGRRPKSRAGEKYRLALQTSNQYLEDYRGAIYERKPSQGKLLPVYTPPMKRLYLKGESVIDKNTLTNHDQVEVIVFGKGVQRVESDAVEGCPNLRTVYLPQSAVSVASNAFTGSNYSVQIKYYTEGQEP